MGYLKSGLFICLDGVIESPETWHFPYFNDQMGAVVGDMMRTTVTRPPAATSGSAATCARRRCGSAGCSPR